MSAFTAQLYRPGLTTGLTVGEPGGAQRSTWFEVHQDAQHLAGGLADRQVGPGSVVAILAASPAQVARIAQACWMRRASVTMVPPPTPRGSHERWLADTTRILDAIGTHLLVLGEPYSANSFGDSSKLETVAISELATLEPLAPLDAVDDDIALLQLTSGSTGTPKAVAITHANLHAGTQAIRRAMNIQPSDCFVSWLPLYHDMGMVGMLLVPMQYSVETVSITPTDFIAEPVLWLELISRYRGTITAAPNFAYGLVAKRLAAVPDGAYDLSTMRFAVIGAEPIDAATIEKFAQQGARFGLRREALVPAYGMAEATLAVTFAVGAGVVVDQREVAEVEDLETSAERPPRAGLVRLGFPLLHMEVTIVRDDGAPARPRQVGEVHIRGAAVSPYYLTAEGKQPNQDRDGWLATGDMGYLTPGGELVLCGRRKDTIIISGRNIYPTDIERVCESVDGVRPGNVVAVRINDHRGEGFAVIAESFGSADDEISRAIRINVASNLNREIGVTPRTVLVVPPGTIPKTSSGKLRRTESRRLIESVFPVARPAARNGPH